MRILVTGGAGYIGSHVVASLRARGDHVVVVDDLSSGEMSRIPGVALARMQLADPASVPALAELLGRERIDSVMHFAARKRVAESLERPAWYYAENVGGLASVVAAMEIAGTDALVFSSSAAVYGSTEGSAIEESATTLPVNPYGETKLAGERLVAACVAAWGLRAVSLRYFNVAGASSPDLADRRADNLVPMVFRRIDAGLAPQVFGDDYDTPDGTCIRDYVHVVDLAEAHIATLEHLPGGGPTHSIFNVGSGRGTSVRQMIDIAGSVSGIRIEPEVMPRRTGDPAIVVASSARIEREIGWRSRYSVEDIVSSAWLAHRRRRGTSDVRG